VNLGANEELPIRDLVTLIAEACEFAGEIRWDDSKPDGQPRRCVDPSLAKQMFGFEATTSFREGLARTVAWYRANREEAEARTS
jgi:GDP-L-fucose synthase